MADHQTPEASDHRCSGCDHRWRGGPAAPNEWTGAELCGDCWRRVQPLLHRPEASDQQRAYDLSEAILRCWSAGQPYVSEAARADMIAIIHAHDAAVRAEQAALYENAQCVTCAGHLDAEQAASDTARRKESADMTAAYEMAAQRIARLEHALNRCEIHPGKEDHTACAICFTEAHDRIAALEQWKGEQQQALIRMALEFAGTGYKGDGIEGGITFLKDRIAALEQALREIADGPLVVHSDGCSSCTTCIARAALKGSNG